MRSTPQPVLFGFSEKPYPAIEGMTTSNASSALPPYFVGSVSGSINLICSTTDPGQQWLMTIGSAPGCFERTWMKWMSRPSMLVMN